MATDINIGDQSCAFFAIYPGDSHVLLGTAFYFRRAGRVLAATAAHCIPPEPLPEFLMAGVTANLRVAVAAIDRHFDVCLLEP